MGDAVRRQVVSDLRRSWGATLKAVVTLAHYRNLDYGSVDTFFPWKKNVSPNQPTLGG